MSTDSSKRCLQVAKDSYRSQFLLLYLFFYISFLDAFNNFQILKVGSELKSML